MLNTYDDIIIQNGFYKAGFYKILIAPREWLGAIVEPDFLTGTISGIPTLIDDRKYIHVAFTPDTYEFEEKPKTGAAGPYYETTLQGLINNITPELMISLQTYNYHEFVAVCHDVNKRAKFVGLNDNALNLSIQNKETSAQGGNQVVQISLQMNSEYLSPLIAL